MQFFAFKVIELLESLSLYHDFTVIKLRLYQKSSLELCGNSVIYV